MFNRTTIEKSEAVFKQISVFLLTVIVFLFAWSGSVVVVHADDGTKATGGLLPIPDKLVVLTLDDANKSDIRTVAPILQQFRFGATFFVTEGLGARTDKKNFLTWEEMKQLDGFGFEIGNHTGNHVNVLKVDRARIALEIELIQQLCRDHRIAAPISFCYPGFQHGPVAVAVLQEKSFLFARRGVAPEFVDPGRGARGPAYKPTRDHPLLIPTTMYFGPDMEFDDVEWAVEQAVDGKITVLCYHGVPSSLHPWVNTEIEVFRQHMKYLQLQGCRVIAVRDLLKYVNPTTFAGEPYASLEQR